MNTRFFVTRETSDSTKSTKEDTLRGLCGSCVKIFNLILIATLFLSLNSQAQIRSIEISGREFVTVTTPKVRLSDIASVSSTENKDDEAVIGLSKLELFDSPAPGESIAMGAYEILDKLKSQGVNTKDVQYTFPKTISVKRASRTLEDSELKRIVSDYLSKSVVESELVNFDRFNSLNIPTGNINLEVVSSNILGMGKRNFAIEATSDDGWRKEFNLSAKVREFKSVPVAKKALGKGSMISENDFVMARLNLDAIPSDAVEEINGVLGFEANKEINSGEVLRLQKISPPIVIQSGNIVTMKYQGGLFEATATGIALESGGIGQEIKVKNDTSKKIIGGKILETGIVLVK